MNTAQEKSPNSMKWEGKWDQLVGKVQGLWANITDDDFNKAKGKYHELLGIIKEKTGKTLEEIERKLNL